MEKLIGEIMESGLFRYASDLALQEDSVYAKDMQDAEQLDIYLRKLISKEQMQALDDYEAAMRSANSRAREISYLTGVRDMIAYLRHTEVWKIL